MPNLPSLFPELFLSTNNGEHTQTIFLKPTVTWFLLNSCVDNSDQATFLIWFAFLMAYVSQLKSWLF